MRLSAYLDFKGDCREAFSFYERVFGAKIQSSMTWGETPMANEMPKDWHGKIVHTSLVVGDTEILGADSPPDRYVKPQGISITIQLNDKKEAERVFKELSQGGTITMPLQETFWSPAFAMFVDRFGIPWMINTETAGQQAAS